MGKDRKKKAFLFAATSILMFSSLSLLFIDSLYCGKINAHADLNTAASRGRPRTLYGAAASLIALSIIHLVVSICFDLAFFSAKKTYQYSMAVAQAVFCLGQVIAASIGIHASRFGLSDWDASDDQVYGNQLVKDYVDWYHDAEVIHVNTDFADGSAPLKDYCFSHLFPTTSLEPYTVFPAMTDSMSQPPDWGFGEFAYYRRAGGPPLSADFPVDWSYLQQLSSYNPLYERVVIPACFGLRLDAETIKAASSESDACELRFRGDHAVCAPGWNLDLLAEKLFCEPFRRCVEQSAETVAAYSGDGNSELPVFTTVSDFGQAPRWYLPTGWDNREQVNDVALSQLKAKFTLEQYTSALTYHAVHSIFLAWIIVGLLLLGLGYFLVK
jgi:hypothetical protein